MSKPLPNSHRNDTASHSKAHVRILIVDDDDVLRDELAQALSGRGYDVQTAQNGSYATEYLRDQSRDIVLTDMLMPTMDGIELLHKIRDSWPQTKTIVMSSGGRMEIEMVKRALTAFGADAVLEKPFEFETVVRAIDELTSK